MANDIKIGSTSIDKVYVGSTAVDKIYVGDTLVWPSWTPPSTYVTLTKTTIGDKPSLDVPSLTTTGGDTWFKYTNDGTTAKIIVCAVQSNSTNYGNGNVYVYNNSGTLLASSSVGQYSVALSCGYDSGDCWIKFTSSPGTANYVAAMFTTWEAYGGLFCQPDNTNTYIATSLTSGRKYYTCAMAVHKTTYYFNTMSTNATYGYFSAGRARGGGWATTNRAYPTGYNHNITFVNEIGTPEIMWLYIDCIQGGTFPMYVN